MLSYHYSLLFALLPWASGLVVPQESLKPAVTGEQPPLITHPSALWDPTKNFEQRRGFIDDLKSKVNTKFGNAMDKIPTHIPSGLPNLFKDIPTGEKVQTVLELTDDEVDALPIEISNMPGYGNWTGENWNLRLHGYAYKKPQISEKKLDALTNIFLIDTSVKELLPTQATQAKDLTADLFVIQQAGVNLKFNLSPKGSKENEDDSEQLINFPYPTTVQGDFDAFVQLKSNRLSPEIQRLTVQTEGITSPNRAATSYLVPPTGITVVSDIDDILRITRIYEPTEALLNTFVRPFSPWLNMPSIFARWSRTLSPHNSPAHFHYLSTTPEQATRAYMEFIYKTYPAGSFDMRPLNFSDVAATMSIRHFLLKKIFATFPQRKFVLVADTSNSDVMKAYPAMALEFPEQVLCVFIRDTAATDEEDRIPYNTKGFREMEKEKYMFFNVPDDLSGLDIANGQCVNATVKQDVTFGWQGLPLGMDLGQGDGVKKSEKKKEEGP